jgi:hypothetical protein
MDLLACTNCGSRFYVPTYRPSDRRPCTQCGADIGLLLHGIKSIPLDARWLGSAGRLSTEATVEEEASWH